MTHVAPPTHLRIIVLAELECRPVRTTKLTGALCLAVNYKPQMRFVPNDEPLYLHTLRPSCHALITQFGIVVIGLRSPGTFDVDLAAQLHPLGDHHEFASVVSPWAHDAGYKCQGALATQIHYAQ